jgi:HD-like signal output (HDOD) protein
VRDRRGSSTRADNYGQGVVELDESADSSTQAERLITRLRGNFATPQYAPPVLPVAALEVHRLSQAKNVKLDAVQATLEKDPLLAARVLKVANSSLYGGAPMQSLQHAVMRIGMKNLSGVVWEVAMNMRVFRCKVYEAPMETLRRHSTAVAHVSRLVAELTSIPLDYAFLCGLLHDCGAAAILLLLGERAPGDTQVAEPLLPDVLDEVLAAAHAEASLVIAKIWKLPDDLQLVLAHHHAVTIGGYSHPTASVIALAQRLVAEEGPALGLPAPTWDTTPLSSLQRAEESLGLRTAALDKLRTRAATLLTALAHAS